MERNIKMTIKVPENMEEDFRVFIVTHGGAIISYKKDKIPNMRIPMNTQKCDEQETDKKLKEYIEKLK